MILWMYSGSIIINTTLDYFFNSYIILFANAVSSVCHYSIFPKKNYCGHLKLYLIHPTYWLRAFLWLFFLWLLCSYFWLSPSLLGNRKWSFNSWPSSFFGALGCLVTLGLPLPLFTTGSSITFCFLLHNFHLI